MKFTQDESEKKYKNLVKVKKPTMKDIFIVSCKCNKMCKCKK